MKKLIAVFALLFSMQSFANVINIDLNGATDVTVGDNVTVTLELDNFDPFDTFSFDLLFDDSLLDFVVGSESSNLPNDGVDTFLEIVDGAGFVGIGFFDFASEQSGDFFVEFDFVATEFGSAAFSLDLVNFENVFNFEFLIVDDSATASVNIAEVSAPVTLSFVIMGIAGLIVRRLTA